MKTNTLITKVVVLLVFCLVLGCTSNKSGLVAGLGTPEISPIPAPPTPATVSTGAKSGNGCTTEATACPRDTQSCGAPNLICSSVGLTYGEWVEDYDITCQAHLRCISVGEWVSFNYVTCNTCCEQNKP